MGRPLFVRWGKRSGKEAAGLQGTALWFGRRGQLERKLEKLQ